MKKNKIPFFNIEYFNENFGDEITIIKKQSKNKYYHVNKLQIVFLKLNVSSLIFISYYSIKQRQKHN